MSDGTGKVIADAVADARDDPLIDMLAAALPHVEDASDDVSFKKDARAGFKRLAKRIRIAIEGAST